MAWERSFEAKVMKVREKELTFQRLCYMLEVRFPIPLKCHLVWALGKFTGRLQRYLVVTLYIGTERYNLNLFCRSSAPVLVQLVSFWHFTVIRNQILTPSVAFTAVSDFLSLSPRKLNAPFLRLLVRLKSSSSDHYVNALLQCMPKWNLHLTHFPRHSYICFRWKFKFRTVTHEFNWSFWIDLGFCTPCREISTFCRGVRRTWFEKPTSNNRTTIRNHYLAAGAAAIKW